MKPMFWFMIVAIVCIVVRLYAERRIRWFQSLYVEVNRPLAESFDQDAKMWSRVSSVTFYLGLISLTAAILSALMALSPPISF